MDTDELIEKVRRWKELGAEIEALEAKREEHKALGQELGEQMGLLKKREPRPPSASVTERPMTERERQIFDAVAAKPAAHYKQIAEQLGQHPTAVNTKLKRMMAAGMLKRLGGGTYAVASGAPAAAPDAATPAPDAIVLTPTAAAIHRALVGQPPLSNAEIRARMDAPPSGTHVTASLNAMTEKGAVRRVSFTTYAATDRPVTVAETWERPRKKATQPPPAHIAANSARTDAIVIKLIKGGVTNLTELGRAYSKETGSAGARTNKILAMRKRGILRLVGSVKRGHIEIIKEPPPPTPEQLTLATAVWGKGGHLSGRERAAKKAKPAKPQAPDKRTPQRILDVITKNDAQLVEIMKAGATKTAEINEAFKKQHHRSARSVEKVIRSAAKRGVIKRTAPGQYALA